MPNPFDLDRSTYKKIKSMNREHMNDLLLDIYETGSGSSTSANFLKKVEPIYAVISVGYENAYGHPSEKLLKRLAERNIGIYRTDAQGTIVFMTDGTEISVNKEPFLYELPAVSDIQPPETSYSAPFGSLTL